MAGFDNDVVYADNVDFSGGNPVTGQVTTDGQILIGSTASPNIRVGSITSSDNAVTINAGSGTIDITAGSGMGTGDVNGPGSSTDLALARWDGTSGELLQDSGTTLTDQGLMSGLRVVLDAGTALAGTAPLKLTSGTNLTTPEEGAIEFDGTNLYYTDSTPTRQTIATLATAGDVSGPGSSTDNALVRWDGATGTVVQNSTGILQDNGNFALDADLTGGLTWELENINAGSSADSKLTLKVADGGGDPEVQFRDASLNFNWSMGVDNSASDVFRIATTTTPDPLTINSSKQITVVENFSVVATKVGTLEALVEQNDTGVASQSRVRIDARTGGGDAYVAFSLNDSVNYAMGIDNSDSDKFKLANTTPSGTSVFETDKTTFDFKIGISYPRSASGAGNLSGTATDYILAVTNTAAPRTVSLPNTGVVTGQMFVIKDETGGAAAQNITINVTGATYNIDGAASQTISTDYGSITVYFNGTEYSII